MIWIFLLGIITLAVYHPGFRKVVLWVGGIGGGLFTLGLLIAMAHG